MTVTPTARYKSFVYDSARWSALRLRPGDIVISTPPKCGTTWTQRICSLLVFQKVELDEPLTRTSPWIDMLTLPIDEVVAGLEAQRHRRFVKTHTPLPGLPWDERVTYVAVGRDPRDVAVSWDGHMANTDFDALLSARDAAVGNADIAGQLAEGPPPLPETPEGRFWAFVDNPKPATEGLESLAGVVHHLESFWAVRNRPNVVLLHYSDLKADLEGQMRALAARLDIDVPETAWPALVKAATFEEMRRNADRTAPGVTEKIWQDSRQFFRSGKSGQWRDLVADEELPRYEKRLDELTRDEALRAWLHGGSSAIAG